VEREIWIARQGSAYLLPVADIAYFRAESKYVYAVTPQTMHKLEDSLDGLSSRLGNEFVRTHRKFLVRLSAVRSLVKIGVTDYLELTGIADPIPVSRREVALVRQAMRERSI
jgi:two-component system response regulator AlgR